MSDDSKAKQLDLIPPLDRSVKPYNPVRSLFNAPLRQQGVIDMLMAENSFFTLSKKDIEDFEYESPEGKFSLKAKVIDKEVGLPTLNDSEILHYIGAVLRDKRLDQQEIPRFFDIQAKQFFDFFGKEPGGQAYIDFMVAIRRLSGTEYEISREVDATTLTEEQMPEYEAGDVIRLVEADRLIKSHKRLQIEKKSGRVVVTAVRVELCDWLLQSLSSKHSSLLFDREHYLNATPTLKMVASIVRKQMGGKSVHTISYAKLHHRCRSKQSLADFKKSFKQQVRKHKMVGYHVELGPPRAKNVTFYRAGNQGLLPTFGDDSEEDGV